MEPSAYHASNPNLLDKDTRWILRLWWMYGILALFMVGITLLNARQLLDYFQEVREHNAFLANSVSGEGVVTHCGTFIGTQVVFDFVPAGSSTTQSGAAHYFDRRSCSRYPLGSTFMIRYLPSDPAQSEAADEPKHNQRSLNASLFSVGGWSLHILYWAWFSIRAWRLKTYGRLRQGRILSLTPVLERIFVRYEVQTDDGKWVWGIRNMNRRNIEPSAEKGAPIAVLYAGRHAHMAVRSIV